MLDLFVNPYAGSYKNRWFWDSALNVLERLPGFPESVSRKIRGATREEDYLFERAYRSADKYGRILRNRGLTHVTATLPEFRKELAQSMRNRPNSPKIICSGDGGIKEAKTTAITYADRHNTLEEKIAQAFDTLILAGNGFFMNINVQDFLGKIQLPEAQSRSRLSPLARTVMREKQADFDVLKGHLELDEQEKKFVEDYDVSFQDLLEGPVPYPTFGIVGGGTFNVLAHNFELEKGPKYLQSLLRQNEEGVMKCSPYQPLQVTLDGGKQLYGTIYGHGLIHAFFQLYYRGKVTPGPMKAAYISFLYSKFHKENFAELTKSKKYSYKVTHGNGTVEAFTYETSLAVATTIGRLPFNIEFFNPAKNSIHFSATNRPAPDMVAKGVLSIPTFRKSVGMFGVKDTYDVEHDYQKATRVTISGDSVNFMLDGDIADETPYAASQVELALGPELKIIDPNGFHEVI
tara:strand:+ start:3258 stop:4640 length:1383 start_codon:yes stop_codon:yes gene_type:complete